MLKRMSPLLMMAVFLSMLLPMFAGAVSNTYDFNTMQQERLFNNLLIELRCPKCQNQNLMDSNSEISMYMKQRIYEQVKAGKSHDEIVDFLRARYGDFITYKPPLNMQTALLWSFPLLALLLGVFIWFRVIRAPQLLSANTEYSEPQNNGIDNQQAGELNE